MSSSRYRWAAPGDINAFFGLMLDNVMNLVILAGILIFVYGFPEQLVYTQMLNERGGIECDLTVARLSRSEYYIVTGTGFATHDFDWIQRSIPQGANAQLFDITSANSVL